jgi:TrmH family RNA methyltransferase
MLSFLGKIMVKRIESRNNPTVKNVTALRDKREREGARLFCFEGVHLLEEYLKAGNTPKMLFVREEAMKKYAALIEKANCEIFEVTDTVYDKITEEKAPQGILTVSEYLENVTFIGNGCPEAFLKVKGNAIMLVDLQDNGNVGTVIRTATAFDCPVLLCGRCADVFSPKTVRATMGALFTGEIFVCTDTVATVEALKAQDHRVIAAALNENAYTLGDFGIEKTDIFAVGNEGNGLSEEVINACSMTAIIPMSGKTESLNAAIASAVLLWEAKRGGIK